uniref:Uncharacterized protein n=1 Tax=Romanomermis culicivorax TaxID=13658 RepID=A0A915HQ29_ROMCU
MPNLASRSRFLLSRNNNNNHRFPMRTTPLLPLIIKRRWRPDRLINRRNLRRTTTMVQRRIFHRLAITTTSAVVDF